MKTQIKFRFPLVAAALLALSLPLYAIAAPVNVTGVRALAQDDGTIKVEWEGVADAASYRVYYGSDSILANLGLYDDFEDTGSTETTYTFTPPAGDLLYISVLAVDANEEESPSFVEEAIVDLSALLQPTTPEPTLFTEEEPVSPVPEEMPTLELPEITEEFTPNEEEIEELIEEILTIPEQKKELEPVDQTLPEWQPRELDASQLHLLSAEATGATGVLLTFSDSVTVDPAEAPFALLIEDPTGNPLRIARIIIDEEEIEVHTEPQERGTVYQVLVDDAFGGEGGQPLHENNRSSFFQGDETGIDPKPRPTIPTQPVQPTNQPTTPVPTQPSQPTAPVDPNAAPPDVSNLRMRAMPQQNGLYAVEAAWEYDLTRGDLGMYVVFQSRDGGVTYSQPQMLPVDIGGVAIPNLEPGELTLRVHTVSLWNRESAGVVQKIALPGPGGVVPQLPAQMPTQPVLPPVQPGVLPQSGTAGMLGVVGILGAVAGWARMRKQKKV